MEGQGQTVRIGMIGCGRAAETLHLPALQKVPGVEVLSLADNNADRLALVADRFDIKQRYSDYRSLIQDQHVDLIAVCVPAQFHAEIALAALDAKKHLFVEKPLALSLDDCSRLIDKAKETDKKIMVGFNLRHHRLIRKAQSILQEGSLGPIEAIHSIWTSALRSSWKVPEWRNHRELGGGALFEIGVHHFDLWRFLLQCEVAQIFALSKSREWSDETVTVNARMTNGVIATAVFSERTSNHNELEICGQKGRLYISLYQFDGFDLSTLSQLSGSIQGRLWKATTFLRDLPKGIAIMQQGGDYKMSYGAEWRHLIGAIQNNSTAISSLEDGKRALQVVLAAIESSSTQQPVTINDETGYERKDVH
jgi:myo-inositol 2-dehydrogenase/D-chiro-inositol 1-dehydrogenase